MARLSAGDPRGARRQAASPPTRSPASACPARCTGPCCSARTAPCCGPRSSGAISAPKPSAAGSTRRSAATRHPRAHVESGAHEFHADQAAVGPHARARRVEPRAPRAAAEGLRPLPAERRVRHRRRRRVRHADARRGAPRAGRARCSTRRRSTRACCPPCSSRRTICARVSRDAAALTGIPAGTPIVAGAGDQAAGAIGMGITRPGAVSATIGTSGVVFAATDRPATDPEGPAAHVLSRDPRALARDGRDAGRRPLAALVPRSAGRRRVVRPADRRGRSASRRAPTACSGRRT